MSVEELKESCIRNHISFIPHHACALCGEEVGWYLFYRHPLYEVAFDSSCACCGGWSSLCEDSWEHIIEWICDKDGNLRDRYKYLFRK